MPSWIDGSLYPDTEIPEDLPTLADRVDFLARLCGAWDFGILPEWETVEEIRQPEWQEAVDATRLLTSPVYHLLRSWHGCRPFPFWASGSHTSPRIPSCSTSDALRSRAPAPAPT